MMKHNIRRTRRIEREMLAIQLILQFMVFGTFMMIIYLGALHLPEKDALRSLVMVVPVCLSYVARQHMKKPSVFYGIHVAVMVLGALLGRTENEMFFNIGIVVVVMVYSSQLCYVNSRVDKERMPLVAAAVFLFAFFDGGVEGSIVMRQTGMIGLAVFVLLEMVCVNLFRVKASSDENADTMNFPEEQFRRVNKYIMAITLTMMTAGMMFFYSGPAGGIISMLAPVGKTIGRAIAEAIIFLIGLFSNLLSGEDIPMTSEPQTEDNAMGALIAGNASGLTENIINAVIIVVAAAIAIGIIVALIVVISRIMKEYSRNHSSGSDEIEFISAKRGDVVEKLPHGRLVRERASGNNEKFRKAYRRKVHRALKKNKGEIAPTAMPVTITRTHLTSEETLAEAITKSYEKARYSEEEISQSELDTIKKV